MESSLNEDNDNNEEQKQEPSPGLSAFFEANLRAPTVLQVGGASDPSSGATAGAGGAGLPTANALRQYIEDMSRNTNNATSSSGTGIQLPASASPGSMLGQGGDHDSAIAAAGLDSASLGAGWGLQQGLAGQNLLSGGLPNNIASTLGAGGQQQQLPLSFPPMQGGTGLQLQQLLASSGNSSMATNLNPLGGLPSLNVSSLTNNCILLGGEQNLNALSSLQQQPQLGASIPGTGMLTGGANFSHLLPGFQQNPTAPLAQQDFLNTLLQQSQEGQQGGAAAAALLANQQAVAPLAAPTPASLMAQALGGSNLLGSLMQQQQAPGGAGSLLAGMTSAGGVTPNATGTALGNLPPSLLAQLSAGTLPAVAGEAAATATTGGTSQQQQGALSQIQPSQIAVSVGQQQQLEAAAAASGGAAVNARPKKPKKAFKREDIPEDKEYEKYVSGLPEVVRDRRIYRHEAFPDKLYRMLEEAEDNGLDHIISFTESGTAFRVINTRIFERQVGPQYFRHNKYSSFRRQLSTYGFQRVDDGPDCGAFSHSLFRQGRPELLPKILRLSEIKELKKQQQQQQQAEKEKKEDEEGEKPPAMTTEETATEGKASDGGTTEETATEEKAVDPPPPKKQKVGNEEDEEDNNTSA